MGKKGKVDYIESDGKEFDQKYKEVLDALKDLPRGTAEEKEERYTWLKNRPEGEAFLIDTINMGKNNSLDKLQERLQKSANTINAKSGIASRKTCGGLDSIDFLVLMESIKEAIGEYTGVNQEGETYSFLQSIGKKYEQKIGLSAAMNDTSEYGLINDKLTKRRRTAILKMIRTVENLQVNLKDTVELKKRINKIWDDSKDKNKGKLNEEEMDYIIRQVQNFQLVESMDKLVEDDESDYSYNYEDKRQNIEQTFLDKEMRADLIKYMPEFIDKWENAINKKNRELLKAFLSKNILILLKLKYLSDTNQRKEYEELMEPTCGNWCPRKLCEVTGGKIETQNIGCYIRYGLDTEGKETGDEEVYRLLSSEGELIYQAILKNAYTSFAYEEKVNGIEDLYLKRLKPFKGEDKDKIFKFTDNIIGTALGIRKDTISKARQKYQKKIIPMIYESFEQR